MTRILVFLLCYLCGAIPFGVIAGKLRGIDVRSVGSGNIGTTNVYRALGPAAGLTVFLLDVLKGFAAPWLARMLLGPTDNTSIALCALIAVLGHTFSIFLNFKGGKGIATGLGAALGLATKPALSCFALWGVVVLMTRMISAGSVAACLAIPVAYWLAAVPLPSLVVMTLISTVAFLKHIPNIKRILAGTEPRLGANKTVKADAQPTTERANVVETRGETVTGS
ncbi:MAG: glycerol-3-phosphate 1-O-acyltransferase PlsY [Abitibacteriaceae bacterium]|nr:glycerol-3-phosphate 1-O-acyltransferase PlsY [Abditibacteriaceae bacterium]MBV9868351.1 glycerol-3-phosphate 1-O-acyltransferase PlsY [Abditibacteriaceae bacterium]